MKVGEYYKKTHPMIHSFTKNKIVSITALNRKVETNRLLFLENLLDTFNFSSRTIILRPQRQCLFLFL